MQNDDNNQIQINITPINSVMSRDSARSGPTSFRRRVGTASTQDGEESHATTTVTEHSKEEEAKIKAARILTPVLSRAREQHEMKEAELESQRISLSETSTTSPESDRIAAGENGGAFKATVQAIQAMTHPVRMPSHKGGEGVRRLVETREHDSKLFGLNTDYWGLSLWSIQGRAWPILPQAIYCIYCTAMIAIIMCRVSDYSNIRELAGLQFPISTMGLALFLLLSFRTNSCYERWWEGRKLWEGMAGKVQDIARIAFGWVAPCDQEAASQLIRWALAFLYVAKGQLRVEDGYPELAGILSQKDIDELEADVDPVAMVLDKLTGQLRQCALGEAATPPPIYSTLDSDIRGLNMDLCGCQRILSTPLPFAYTVHLRSFMALWLLGLPFGFVVTLGWWSIIVCVVVGYELFGFETIGVEIENPFGRDYNDLPLDAIATENFVKLACVLAKLNTQADIGGLVERVIEADPLHRELHTHMRHTKSEGNFQDMNGASEKETGVGKNLMDRLTKSVKFSTNPGPKQNGHQHDDGDF